MANKRTSISLDRKHILLDVNKSFISNNEKSQMLYRKMLSCRKKDYKNLFQKEEAKLAVFLRNTYSKTRNNEENMKNSEITKFGPTKRLGILNTTKKSANLKITKSIDETIIDRPLFFKKPYIVKNNVKIQKNYITAKRISYKSDEYPNSRMLVNLVTNGNKLYIFGGISSYKHFDLWVFDLKTSTWKRIYNSVYTSFAYFFIHIYNNTFYIVSVQPLQYDNKFFLPKILKLSVKDNNYDKVRSFDKFRISSFGICGYSQYLFIVGGSDEYEKLVDTINIFDLKTLKFEPLNIYYKYLFHARKLPAIIFVNYNDTLFHKDAKTQILCFEKEHPLNGLYIFGGTNNDHHLTEMFKVSFKVKGIKIKKINYTGEAPRFKHPKMFYLKKSGYLVANENIYVHNNINNFDLQLACFILCRNEWIIVKKDFNMRLLSYGISNNDETIYIFGGISKQRLFQNTLYSIDFSNYKLNL